MNYYEKALLGADAYRKKDKPIMLAIESSCDETAASIVRGGREVLSMSVFTQIPIHRKYGGVVPELASRSHVEKVGSVVADALEQANLSIADVDAVSATYGPGLVGALLVGLSYAKGLAYAANKPFIGADHIAGHIAANYLSYPDLEPPFVCLVASGGHSHIILVEGYNSFKLLGCTREIIGTTIDDAAGEAFDKVARALGLNYPGGPELERLAREGDPDAYSFRGGFNESDSLDFSFSGIKTAVVNLMHNAAQKGETLSKADIAASFQRAVCDTLTLKAVHAAKEHGFNTLALAGGVSANRALRSSLARACEDQGIRFCCPDFRYCTDNAAMIACAGHYALMAGELSGLDLNAAPELPLVQR